MLQSTSLQTCRMYFFNTLGYRFDKTRIIFVNTGCTSALCKQRSVHVCMQRKHRHMVRTRIYTVTSYASQQKQRIVHDRLFKLTGACWVLSRLKPQACHTPASYRGGPPAALWCLSNTEYASAAVQCNDTSPYDRNCTQAMPYM